MVYWEEFSIKISNNFMGNFRLNQEYEQDEGLYLSNDFPAVGRLLRKETRAAG